MSKTETPDNDADETPTDVIDRDYPRGLDPNDLPPGVDKLWISSPRSSRRRYHLDKNCGMFHKEPHSRRANIAAAWYEPCKYCVTGEYPLTEEDYGEERKRNSDWNRADRVQLHGATQDEEEA